MSDLMNLKEAIVNGKLEEALFDLLSEIDARLYIIDCMPNLAGKEASAVVYQRTLEGVKKLREKSRAPILLVEHDGYSNEFSSESAEESYRVANAELRKAYETLQKEQVPAVYYLTKEEIGMPMDAMVDGVHSTDLGMQQYADSYRKKIGEILHEESEGPTSCIPCKQQRDPYDWYGRHEEILKLNKQSAPEVVMIGNSITHFWGGEPIAHNQFGTESWDKLFKGKRVRNLGFGWDKTENVLWRIYHGELDGFQAQNIFLLIGTNNLLFNTDDEVIEGICRVVKAIHERQPRAKLCVMGILPRKEMETRIAQIDAALQERLNGKDCTFINLAPQLTHKDGTIDHSLFRDGLHPNAEGYKRIAKVLKGYL
jgi:lysophospholipase L1-like esterase